MGVFKTAPTGAGTAIAAVAVGGATAAAAATASPSNWEWMTNHAVLLIIGVIAAGIFIDLGLALFNNEKNQLKVTDVPVQ